MAEWNQFEKQRQVTEPTRENNEWKNMLSMLSMVNSTRPETMAGYGLGKLLKRWIGTAWDDYQRSREEKRNSRDKNNSLRQQVMDQYSADKTGVAQPGLLDIGQLSSAVPGDISKPSSASTDNGVLSGITGAVNEQPGLTGIAYMAEIPELPDGIKKYLPQRGE